jgi:hypothetical protein
MMSKRQSRAKFYFFNLERLLSPADLVEKSKDLV